MTNLKKKYVEPYLGNSLLGNEEEKNLKTVLFSKMLFRYQEGQTYSKKVEFFLQKKLKISHAKVLCNASEALKIALISLKPKVGSIVLIPAISYIATANCCLNANLVPVLIDVEKDGHLDPIELEKFLETNDEKPCAVIVAHLDGSGAQIEKITDICKKYNIPLIEDTAQAFSVKRNNKYLGTFGDIGCFSFQSNKFISSGEGGAFVSNNIDLFERMCALSDQGSLRPEDTFPNWDKNLGYGSNLKITELCSSILYAQMKKLDDMKKKLIAHYREIIKYLDERYFIKRHIEDLPLSIWIEDTSYAKSLEEKNILLYSYDYMLLSEHPIIKEKRSLYQDNFPWNYYKKNIVVKDTIARVISKRFCLPVPILTNAFENLMGKLKIN